MVLRAGGSVALALVVAGVASADPRAVAPALVGATEIAKLTPPSGFIDDVVAFDADRLAYVIADNSARAELHILNLASKHEEAVDITQVTLHPIAIRLLGARAFVVGLAEDGTQNAALVELAATPKAPAGAIVYKLGPATTISVVTRDGQLRAAVHKVSEPKENVTRHEVELDSLETGKRVAGGHPVEVDTKGADKKLDFKVNHWADGFTRVFGYKGGEWNKKDDTRAPDAEASYDLISGQFGDRAVISDLFEQRKRYQTLAEVGTQIDFVKMSWDNTTVQVWHNGRSRTVVLEEHATDYDPKSLQGFVNADGSAWFALKIDPVNPDAVARKKADAEYLDIFHVGADGTAERRARVLSKNTRFKLGMRGGTGPAADQFWLLERSGGIDRGGKALTLYQVQ